MKYIFITMISIGTIVGEILSGQPNVISILLGLTLFTIGVDGLRNSLFKEVILSPAIAFGIKKSSKYGPTIQIPNSEDGIPKSYSLYVIGGVTHEACMEIIELLSKSIVETIAEANEISEKDTAERDISVHLIKGYITSKNHFVDKNEAKYIPKFYEFEKL